MSLSKERITYLLDVYTSGKATASEEQELMAWIADSGEDSELKTYVQHLWRSPESQSFHYVNWDQMFSRVVQKQPQQVITMQPASRRMPWWRISAAAAAVLAVAAGIYWLLPGADTVKPVASREATAAVQFTNPDTVHIPAPQSIKAVITLADGSVLQLDKQKEGLLRMQAQTRIILGASNYIYYQATFGDKESRDMTNTITNPRGSRVVQVHLSDGTLVWLNAGSSVTFPVKFPLAARRIALSGEAYFEVKPGASWPLTVTAEGMDVKVLGTRFNVNTFGAKTGKRVTLLDGAVRVTSGTYDVALKPGMQALVNDSITVSSNVKEDAALAWKNGFFTFSFKGATLGGVLEEMGRWYDIHITAEGDVTEVMNRTFGGKIQRFGDFSGVLRVLTENNVHYKMEGRNLILLP